MTNIVVLAEEPSGQVIAECLAQKLSIADHILCLQHQGKSDLERSFPRKIGHWRSSRPPRFIVMRDNDGANCLQLKARLLALVPRDAVNRVKIRLVVQELESWYLGDLDAVRRAGLLSQAQLVAQKRKAILRTPDRIGNAKQIFKNRVAEGGQIELARRIGPHLSLTDNKSPSFHAFVGALRWASEQPATR
jgi:hypothetical protein